MTVGEVAKPLVDQIVVHEVMSIDALAAIIARTLPDAGMDRMTSERIEEMIATPALTAHI